MEQECLLCGRYIELIKGRDVWTLKHVSDDQEGFVCDRCINEKLNFGEPVGSCLYCDREVDYKMHRYGVDRSHDGPVIYAQSPSKPMVCEEHFQELVEDEQDHTLDIEEVLAEKSESSRPETDPVNLVGEEEDKHLEYKETMLWDVYQDQANSELREEVAEEVCAFGNSQGGVVIIGVEDETKDVVGLERDYSVMKNDRDDFELQLNQEISDKLGETFGSRYVTIEFHEINADDICTVAVEPSESPVFFDEDEFYIRVGSSSRPLTMQESHTYIEEHWQ